MRIQTITIASLLVLAAGACGDVVEADSAGNPADGPTADSVSSNRFPLTGGTLTITGSGFTEGTKAILGTTRLADVTVSGETELVIQVPAGSEADVPYPLSIYTESGSLTLEDAITYNALPTIASAWPPVTSVGSGGTLTIAGTGFATNNNGPVKVHIGEAELANVQVVDDQTITATIGPGSMDLVAIAQDVVVETSNGILRLPAQHTYVSGGLFFTRSRIPSNGGPEQPDPDESLGIYYADIVSKRWTYVLPLQSGSSKLSRTPTGGLAARYTSRGSISLGNQVLGTVDLQEGTNNAVAAARVQGSEEFLVSIRNLALAAGTVFATGDYYDGAQQRYQLGKLNLQTARFTAVGEIGVGHTRGCIAEGPAGFLLAIENFGATLSTINTNTGAVSPSGIPLTGDTGGLDSNGIAAKCHGSDIVGTVFYAIRFLRNPKGTATLVTVSAAGVVTEIMDLPDYASGLAANPML